MRGAFLFLGGRPHSIHHVETFQGRPTPLVARTEPILEGRTNPPFHPLHFVTFHEHHLPLRIANASWQLFKPTGAWDRNMVGDLALAGSDGPLRVINLGLQADRTYNRMQQER
jgi:hypothetical protein